MRLHFHNSPLAKIPVRYRISGGVIVFTLCLWLLSLGHFEHYFTSIHAQIRFARGELTYVVPTQNGFRYAMWRPFVASILLAAGIAIYPLLCTIGGVSVLAIALNFLTCGMEFGNPLSALCVLVFDIALFMLGVQWSATPRKKPAATGRCATCGYDLRATPTRCPECGTAVPPWRNNDRPPE